MADVILPGLLGAFLIVLVIWLARGVIPARIRPKAWWQLGGVFVLAAFGSAAALDYGINEPIASAARVHIAAELSSVAQPADAVRVSYTEENKSSSALAQGGYRTAMSWTDLRAHFDRVLSEAGWSFVKEHGYTDDGIDYGSRTACYARGNDRAAIDMPGSDPDFRGTTYFFSIRWELGGAPSCL